MERPRPILTEKGVDGVVLGALGFRFAMAFAFFAASYGIGLAIVQLDEEGYVFWMTSFQTVILLSQIASLALLAELPVWLATKARNLTALGVRAPFAAKDVLRSFARPGWNLLRPYHYTQEIWRLSQPDPAARRGVSPAAGVAGIAWICVALLWISGVVCFLLIDDREIASQIAGSVLLAQNLVASIATFSTWRLVLDIESRQRAAWAQQGRTFGEALAPTRELGPRHAVLALLVGLGASHVAAWVLAVTVTGPSWLVLGLTQICLALSSLFILRHPDWSRFGTAILRKATGPPWWRWLAAALCLGSGWALMVSTLAEHALGPYYEKLRENAIRLPQAEIDELSATITVLALFVAPVVEELVFRGLMLPTFRLRWDPAPAVLVTSLFFALIHSNPPQIVATFFLGVLCGCLRLASMSLWPAIVTHFVYNWVITETRPVFVTETAGISLPLWVLPLALAGIVGGGYLALCWRPREVNPLLHFRWWWGRTSLPEGGLAATVPMEHAMRLGSAASSLGSRLTSSKSASRLLRGLLAILALFQLFWFEAGERLSSTARHSRFYWWRENHPEFLTLEAYQVGLAGLTCSILLVWAILTTRRVAALHPADSPARYYLSENLGISAKRLLLRPLAVWGALRLADPQADLVDFEPANVRRRGLVVPGFLVVLFTSSLPYLLHGEGRPDRETFALRWWFGGSLTLLLAGGVILYVMRVERGLRIAVGEQAHTETKWEMVARQLARRFRRLPGFASDAFRRIALWAGKHSAKLAVASLAAVGGVSLTWLLLLPKLWVAFQLGESIAPFLALDRWRALISTLSVVAFVAWTRRAVRRASGQAPPESEIRPYLPSPTATFGAFLQELVLSPQVTLGALRIAATSPGAEGLDFRVIRRHADGLFTFFAILAVTGLPTVLLFLPSETIAGQNPFAGSGWLALSFLAFRWTLGAILALLLTGRAARYLYDVESGLRRHGAVEHAAGRETSTPLRKKPRGTNFASSLD